MSKTRMTVGQAIVKFLNQQYIEMDGKEEPFVDGMFTIFGHGMVVGLGQALEEDPGHLRVYQGRNEQGMAHAAISYAKQHNRRKIIACTSSIGVGAANMVTAALTATITTSRCCCSRPITSQPVSRIRFSSSSRFRTTCPCPLRTASSRLPSTGIAFPVRSS